MQRFIDYLTKPRKGNLIAILLFAVMIAIMSFGSLSVASSLYVSNKSRSKTYANIQSYRSAAEIAARQYTNDLQSVTVTKNLSGEWITETNSAMYSEAIETIVNTIGQSAETNGVNFNPLIWKVSTISDAIKGANISDASVVINLMALIDQGRNSFELTVADYPGIDWDSLENTTVGDQLQMALQPIEVTVDLRVKGETLKETFSIEGLILVIEILELEESTTVNMRMTERESGVRLYRD